MLGENERQWKKKLNENTYDIFSRKRVTKIRSFWKFHILVVQNNGKDMYKRFAARAKLLFLLIRPIVVFHRSLALPSPLRIILYFVWRNFKYYRELRF